MSATLHATGLAAGHGDRMLFSDSTSSSPLAMLSG
jgi:hypothetical protein